MFRRTDHHHAYRPRDRFRRQICVILHHTDECRRPFLGFILLLIMYISINCSIAILRLSDRVYEPVSHIINYHFSLQQSRIESFTECIDPRVIWYKMWTKRVTNPMQHRFLHWSSNPMRNRWQSAMDNHMNQYWRRTQFIIIDMYISYNGSLIGSFELISRLYFQDFFVNVVESVFHRF